MAFVNTSFEDAGVGDGGADGWTRAVVSTAEELADFGGARDGADRFETGWDNDAFLFAFSSGDIVSAPFTSLTATPKPADDFESGWSTNEGFAFGLPGNTMAVYDGNPFENFEQGWGNTSYVTSFAGIGTDLTAATYNGNPFENFEQGWNNGSFVSAFAGIGSDLTAAVYAINGGSSTFEGFESNRRDLVFLADPGADEVTVLPTNPYPNDSKVTIVPDASPGAYLPGGLSPVLTYYVLPALGSNIQLSLTIGGPAVDITNTGAGSNLVRADPTIFWTEFMSTI